MNNMEKGELLELKNMSVYYGGVQALHDVSVTFKEGRITALMGPNGAGKSTLLKSIFGLVPIKNGQVIWEGVRVSPIPYKMVKLGISFVPQGKRVFEHLSVYENLEVGGSVIGDKDVVRERIEVVMKTFPMLHEKRKMKSGTLSGGQQQMLALARGLITEPRVLLLDEPSLGLAPKIVKEVFTKIREINEIHKTTIIVVEHNIRSLLNVASEAYVLNRGEVVYGGDAKSLEHTSVLEDVFLGKIK